MQNTDSENTSSDEQQKASGSSKDITMEIRKRQI